MNQTSGAAATAAVERSRDASSAGAIAADVDVAVLATLRRFSRAAGIVAAAAGVAVLAAWAAGYPPPVVFDARVASIQPLTALGIALAGLSLVLAERRRGLSAAAAGGVALIGGGALAQFAGGVDLGVDRLLFAEAVQAQRSYAFPGRPAEATALCLLLLGLGLLLRRPTAAVCRRASAVAASTTLILAGAVVVGYVYDVQALSSAIWTHGVAVPTALLLVLLALGLLAADPRRTWLGVTTLPGEAGRIARTVLPLVLAVPTLLGLVVRFGHEAGLYPVELVPPIMAVLTAVALLALTVALVPRLAAAEGGRSGAEAALRESEQRLDTLANHAPVLLWFNSPAGAEFVNRAYLDFLGVGDVDVRGYDWARFVHPDDRGGYVAAYLAAVESRSEFDAEFRFRRRDGEYRWMRSVGRPRLDIRGRLLGYVGSTIDVTERRRAEAALRESEARLLTAKRAADLGIHDYHVPSGRITWDDRVRELWGIAADVPVTYETFLAGVHPDDRAATQAAVDRALDPGGSGAYRGEYRVVDARSGVERWVRASGRAFFESGRALRLVGTVEDVSDRKRAERALQDAQTWLREALAAARAGAWEWDVRSDRGTLSAESAQLFGVEAPDPLSFDEWLQRCVHRDDRERLRRQVLSITESGADEFRMEFRTEHPTRGLRWILSRGRGDRRDGAVMRILGLNIDVTEQKLAERALRESEERLRLAQEAAGFGVYDFDVTTRSSVWSPQLKAICGLSPDAEVDWRVIAETIHPDDRARVLAQMAAALDPAGSGTVSLEFRARRPDGDVRWLCDHGRVYYDGEGDRRRAVRVVGTIVDITRHRQAEERQRLLTREVDHRAKNLLAVVQSILQLSRADDTAAFVDTVRGRLMALSRAHTLLSESSWEGADLDRLVDDELAPFRTETARVVAGGPPVTLSPAAGQSLALALHELATNAAKYGALSRPSGRLAVHWRVDESGLELTWTEAGGPEVLAPPVRMGFGGVVLKASLEHTHGGRATLDWRREGLHATLRLPAGELRRRSSGDARSPDRISGGADRG